MKSHIKKILFFLFVLFNFSITNCVSIKKSVIHDGQIFQVPNRDQYSVIGSMKISKLYFDPIKLKSSFDSASDHVLNNIVPDVLYDLKGDICWISNFDIITHSIKCLGLCTEIQFDIIALKQN